MQHAALQRGSLVMLDLAVVCQLDGFALSCSIVLWLSGGSFVRKGLSGSQALLERVCGGDTGPALREVFDL